MSTPYTVVSGDSLVGIAKKYGIKNWQLIYNDPDNSDFRRKRPNPDLIFPGDIVIIPTGLGGSGGAAPTQGATMSALAEKDKIVSIQWALAALRGLTEAKQFLVSPPPGPLPGFPPIMPSAIKTTFDALEIHFHISTSAIPMAVYIDKVIFNYKKVLDVLNNSKAFFVDDTTSAEAAKGTPAHVPWGSGKVNFTPSFKEWDKASNTGFGPKCRAAMVLHEPIHIVDHPDASSGANHVHENSPNYASQLAANQLHNAHSYACFAQHVFFGSDTRFGVGKPDQ